MTKPISDLYYKDLIAQNTPIDLGVAEMDWGAAPFLQQNFSQFTRLGYGNDQSLTYYQAVNHWFDLQYGKTLKNKDVIYVGSLKYAIKTIFNLESGEKKVLNFTPYYNGYQDIFSPEVQLVNYDFAHLEQELNSTITPNSPSDVEQFIVEHQIKFILISNPHNPTGKILSATALAQLTTIAQKHQLYLIVDEAHADIFYLSDSSQEVSTDHSLTSAAFSEYERCFCLRSIGKTFNVSGIGGGYLITKQGDLANQLRQIIRYDGQSSPNVFGYWLTIHGYTQQGKTYIDQLNRYFFEQKTFLAQALAQYCHHYISYQPQTGTYLAWVDYTNLAVSEEQLRSFLMDAHINVNFASMYGEDSKFFRVNIATSREKLIILIKQLNAAVNHFTSTTISCDL